MSIRKNLAANLRRLCDTGGSISAICRELGINRSQFDRYLQGKVLPNNATTRRICVYFRISEPELFEGSTSTHPGGVPPNLPAKLESLLREALHPPAPPIEDGTYFTYFSIPGRSDMMMRTVTFIKRESDVVTFRRVTGWSERQGAWAYARGNHYGVAISCLNWIYFSALNRRETGEPSMIAVQWAPISEPVLVGTAMLLTEVGPTILKAFMRRDKSGIGFREAVRMAHAVPVGVDPLIAKLSSAPSL